MASYCKLELLGAVQSEPVMKQSPNGESVCGFGMSVTQEVKDRFGRMVNETLPMEVEVFGRLAEVVMSQVKVGFTLLLDGHVRQYAEQNGPRKTYRLVAVAESINVIGDEAPTVLEAPQMEELPPEVLQSQDETAFGQTLPN